MSTRRTVRSLADIADEPKRLRSLAKLAISEAKGNFPKAIADLGAAVTNANSAALERALTNDYRERAIRDLLRSVANEMPAAKSAKGGGRADHGRREIFAPSRSHKPSTAVADVAKRMLMDTFKINGVSLRGVTVREARGWATSRDRDARFVRLMTDNLPLDSRVGDRRSDADADAFWAAAEREARAA